MDFEFEFYSKLTKLLEQTVRNATETLRYTIVQYRFKLFSIIKKNAANTPFQSHPLSLSSVPVPLGVRSNHTITKLSKKIYIYVRTYVRMYCRITY